MNALVMEASRWELVFTLLSLDGVAPLYKAMGLSLPEKQQFIQVLRRHIADDRNALGTDAGSDSALTTHVLEELEAAFGKQVAEHFYKWATTVFYTAHWDQPHWSAWELILSSLIYERPQHVSLPPEKYEALTQFLELKSVADVEQRLAALRTQPLSDWDAEMYLINQFSNVEDPMCEDDFVDPYVFILSTIEMSRFQRGWEPVIAQLSVNEKMRLWEYGKQLLSDERIKMPEQLRHPDKLYKQV